jgi:hypothetical protein
MAQKMLPPNVTVWWVPLAPGIEDIDAPSAAEINAGTNISCAIVDPYTLGWTDRDTDDSASICDDSNVETPTRKNYEGNLSLFRDADLTDATSVFNIAVELFKVPLQAGYLVQRVGKNPNDFPMAADGDEVSVFQFLSGDPNIVKDNNAPVQAQIRFYAQGRSSNGLVTVGGAS